GCIFCLSFFFSSRRRHTRFSRDWSSDVCSSDLLDLPTTRERLRLIIESDPEETQGTLAEQGSQRLRGDSQSAGDTVVGLSRLTDRDWKQHWDTRFSAGIKVRLPLDPYLRWDAKRLWDLGDGPWMLASENRLSWFNS